MWDLITGIGKFLWVIFQVIVLFNLLIVVHELGHYWAALRASCGGYGNAAVLAGQCHHRLGNPASASALLETAMADHPDDARLFYVLMGALRDDGRQGAADRRAARLADLTADDRVAVGLAEFFNRYDHHGWSRLDNEASLATMAGWSSATSTTPI